METPADTGPPPTDPERESAGPRGEGHHERMPIPRNRAIRWLPRKFGVAEPSITTSYDVFLTRDVLRAIDDQMAEAPGREVGGLLAGRLYRCPDTDRPYIVVDATAPCPRKLPEETASRESGVSDLESAFEGLWEAAETDGRVVAGWYHNHTLLGVFLSERDARFHLRCFPERWQCALVRIGAPDRPAGGVFQWTERGGLRRNICLPFWELLETEAELAADRERSAVAWRNYVADPATAAPSSISSAGSATQPGAARDGPREPTSAGPREAGSDPAAGVPAGKGSGAPRAAGRSGGGAEAADAPGGGEPSGGPDPPDPGRPSPGEDGPGREPPRERRAPIERGPATRPGEVELPLILPPERPEDRFAFWRRHRRALSIAGAVALVLAAGWLLFALIGDGGRERPATSVSQERFAALAEEFEQSGEAFRRLRERFEAGEVDCAPVTAAYRDIDAAFLALSEHFARVRDELGSVALARYEGIARAMEELDASFNATGCPRPA